MACCGVAFAKTAAGAIGHIASRQREIWQTQRPIDPGGSKRLTLLAWMAFSSADRAFLARRQWRRRWHWDRIMEPKFDLVQTLDALAKKRPVFHSEADFQFALAWLLQERHPKAEVRLEYRAAKLLESGHPAKSQKKAYIDIWIEDQGAFCAIELKYKTWPLTTTVEKEEFNLLDQSAENLGRYDFCRDIGRLEKLKQEYRPLTGFAVFLTNDERCWLPRRGDENVDCAKIRIARRQRGGRRKSGQARNLGDAFRLHEGAVLKGTLKWALRASAGTKHGREDPICLAGKYKMSWLPYSKCGDGGNAEFRRTVVTL